MIQPPPQQIASVHVTQFIFVHYVSSVGQRWVSGTTVAGTRLGCPGGSHTGIRGLCAESSRSKSWWPGPILFYSQKQQVLFEYAVCEVSLEIAVLV